MNEVIIYSTPRGYRFQLPYAPSQAMLGGLKAFIPGYIHGSKGDDWRSFPSDKLNDVISFLQYWLTDSPRGDGINRIGKPCYGVRVAAGSETAALAA